MTAAEAIREVDVARDALADAITFAEETLRSEVASLFPEGYLVSAWEYDGYFMTSIREPGGHLVGRTALDDGEGDLWVGNETLAHWAAYVLAERAREGSP